MNFELRLSSEAEHTIEDQLPWYESDEKNGGSQLAVRWLESLESALETSGNTPNVTDMPGKMVDGTPELQICQPRFKPWKNPSAWRVLFVIDPELMIVTILQIRHEKRSPLF